MEHIGKATLVEHCAIYGRLETPVRLIQTGEPKPHAQHQTSVTVFFKGPGRRKGRFITILPDGIRYAQIEVDGAVIWDSREFVPCDMAKWEEAKAKRAKYDKQWGIKEGGIV